MCSYSYLIKKKQPFLNTKAILRTQTLSTNNHYNYNIYSGIQLVSLHYDRTFKFFITCSRFELLFMQQLNH